MLIEIYLHCLIGRELVHCQVNNNISAYGGLPDPLQLPKDGLDMSIQAER